MWYQHQGLKLEGQVEGGVEVSECGLQYFGIPIQTGSAMPSRPGKFWRLGPLDLLWLPSSLANLVVLYMLEQRITLQHDVYWKGLLK